MASKLTFSDVDFRSYIKVVLGKSETQIIIIMKYLSNANLKFYQSSARCTEERKKGQKKRLEKYNSKNS